MTNTITVNYDNAKYRLVVGQPYFTAYYRNGTPPERFDIFDDANIHGFLTIADIRAKGPAAPIVHDTAKNTFVWGGMQPVGLVERYDEASERYSCCKLSTKFGKQLVRAMLRAKAKQAA